MVMMGELLYRLKELPIQKGHYHQELNRNHIKCMKWFNLSKCNQGK